jgi:type II secretory pathway component GspD/PulD (secretin)/Spy/CpxP family protein refolding chaperone
LTERLLKPGSHIGKYRFHTRYSSHFTHQSNQTNNRTNPFQVQQDQNMKRLNRTSVVFVLALATCLSSQQAFAQRGGASFGPLDIARMDEVVAELKMTDEQKTKLSDIRTAAFTEARGVFRASEEERPKLIEALRAKVTGQVNSALKPDQATRLTQLYVQRMGYRVLADDATASELKLSDDQKAKIKAAMDESTKARSTVRFDQKLSREERDAKSEELSKARDAKIAGLLSDTQKSAFEAKKGRVFVFADQRTKATVAQAPAVTADGSRPDAGAATAVPSPGSNTVGTSAAPMGDPVLSFGGSVKKGESVQELSFNFRYAPWADVLEMFAAAAGLTLDLGVTPVGTFNYFDDKKYTPTQALDVINGYLLQKGYLIIQRDKFLVVLRGDDPDNPIPPNLIPIVTVEELAKRGNNELLEVDIQLEGLSAKDAATEVEELIGRYGKVVGLKLSNRLVIRDTGANLRRIHRLLTGVKVDGDRVFRRFQLEHIDVVDAEVLIRELFGLPAGAENVSAGSASSRFGYSRSSSSSYRDPRFGSGGSSSRTPTPAAPKEEAVNVTTDERTNALLITASPADIKIAEEAIKAIDVEGNGEGGGRGNNKPYLEVYQLQTASAQEVAKTLGVLYPGTVVNEDGESGRLHIQATPKMHKDIAEAIRRLDGLSGGLQVAVIPLGRLDAYTATASIQSLFFNDVNAPVIQPHPTNNALILRGQPQQIDQVRKLLEQMDPTDRAKGGGNVRTIPLGGRNAKEFANLLEKMINNSGRAKIRQIVPSAGGPIRSRRIPGIADELDKEEPADTPLLPADLFNLKTAPAAKPATPATEADAPKAKADTSADAERHREKFRSVFATFRQEKPAYEESVLIRNASQETTQATEVQENTPKTDPAPEPEKSATAATGEIPNIVLTIQNGNLIAFSTDQDALDALEEMVDSLAEVLLPKNQWTVFYLQSADATETATVLERIFPTSSVSTTSTSGGGGLLGELTGGLSSMGRGLMNMSGMDMLTSGPTTLRIIPDLRTNSLFVSGPPHLVDEVEETLAILDASELPEQLRARAPRYIEVKHADVNEVAEMIREVYKEEMTAPQQSRGGAGQNPLAAIMGGGGGGRGGSRGGSGGGGAANKIKLTLGVDSRNSRLVISASESLYLQVEGMVKQIDDASLASVRTTRVIPLEHANTTILKRTLGTLMPRVRVSSSSTSSRTSSGTTPQPSSNSTGRPSSDDIQKMLQQRQGGTSSRGAAPSSTRGGSTSGRPSGFGGSGGRPSFGGGTGGGRPSFGGGGGGRSTGGRGR